MSFGTLSWALTCCEDRFAQCKADPALLKIYPSSDGMMHDECMVGMGGARFHWRKTIRDVPDTAQLHSSVYERLQMARVRNFTSYGPYRPAALGSPATSRSPRKSLTQTGFSLSARQRLLAARCARGLAEIVPLRERRAQGMPDAGRTRGLAC